MQLKCHAMHSTVKRRILRFLQQFYISEFCVKLNSSKVAPICLIYSSKLKRLSPEAYLHFTRQTMQMYVTFMQTVIFFFFAGLSLKEPLYKKELVI